jgi:hypothetical protein
MQLEFLSVQPARLAGFGAFCSIDAPPARFVDVAGSINRAQC